MLAETVPQLESEMVRNGRVFPNRFFSLVCSLTFSIWFRKSPWLYLILYDMGFGLLVLALALALALVLVWVA